MIQKKILLPEKIKIISEEGNKGSYEIDKLYPGYGHTLGNSLRRVILSSIPGIAITRVFIKGVPHEFSVVEGVKEDVINIILNLKKIVFKMHTEEPVNLTLNVTKSGKITAKDIEVPSQVEIVNPDTYLFTIEKGKKIHIDFEIAKGLGYVSKEEIKDSKKLKIGEIIMDSSFTPIRRVSYEISQTRVDNRIDFNKILFSIETDGSITPTEAIYSSIKIMIDQFKVILGEYVETVDDNQNQKSIATLKLSGDILQKIATAGILNISELNSLSDDEILKIEGVDKDDLQEINKSLGK